MSYIIMGLCSICFITDKTVSSLPVSAPVGVGQSASQITTDIAGWRSKLTRAIASMNTALEAEALKRKETGQDVGKQLEAAIARMERVQEVSCKLVQKSFNDVFALLYV